MNEAIAQEAARKDVKDIADSHGAKTSASGDSGGVNEVTRDNRKSRFRFTKRGKGHVRDGKSGQSAETRSGASAVVSRITRKITADTKVQSVSSVTKQAICSLNVLMGSPLLTRRKIDNMSVLQRIPRN